MKRITYTLTILVMMLPLYATSQTYTITSPTGGQYTFCVGSYLELPALPAFNTTPIAYTWMISSGTTTSSAFTPFQNRVMTSNDNNHYIQLKVIEADSTIIYSNKLRIYSRTSSSENKTITSCDSYTWHGVTYMESTTVPTFDTVNAYGCQHTVHLHLTIKHSTNSTTQVDTCNSFTWYGTTYHNSINTTHYGLNYDNCPDTHNLQLTIHHNNTNGNDYANVCDSYTWHGSTYTSSGNYQYNTQTIHGCDSVCTLHLTIRNSTTGTDVQSVCDSYTWHGITYMASTNLPTFDTVNAYGCQHTVHLNLTIRQSTNVTEVVDTCDSFTWYGATYNTSLNTMHVGTNAANCPDTHNLHLTVHYSNTNGNDYANVCDNFTWHGSTYTSSGDYPYITHTAYGCDSVCTLHLTIRNSNSGTDVHSVCDSYTWIDGNTYTSNNNTAQYVIYNSQHCDSTVTLNLTVFHSDTNAAVSANVCDTYDWNGHTYTTTGVYPYTTTTVHGCDSLCKLYLTVRKSTSHNDFVTECHQYTWMNNVTYYSDTNTQHTILNTQGCDSVSTLFLTIIPNERPPVRELIVKNLGTDSPQMILYPRSSNEPEYAYQWFKDGEAIKGSNKQYHMIDKDDFGSYTFSVYVSPVEQVFCGSNSSKDIVVSNISSKDVLTIGPNPNNGTFSVSLAATDDAMKIVSFYNAQGACVLTLPTDENMVHIDGLLPQGIYLIKVTTNNGVTYNDRVVIK